MSRAIRLSKIHALNWRFWDRFYSPSHHKTLIRKNTAGIPESKLAGIV